MGIELDLLPCRNCGQPKVVRPGDYCKSCALTWDSLTAKDEYFVVDEGTIEDTAQVTGKHVEYLRGKMEAAAEDNCSFVLYSARSEWQEIQISERFYIPNVMARIFARLHD